MIIFDTTELYGLHRGNPRFRLLRALKRSGSHAAGIPWMVREELVAQRVLEYAAAWNRAEAAVKELNRKTPWRSSSHIPPREIEKAKEYWRAQYDEVLVTLETSGDDAKLALAREAYCEKPAKIDRKSKGGARDAAIWLSVVSYLKEHPEETAYFVSDNVRDFGDGTSYSAPMSDDLRGMESRLSFLRSFDEVISRFTEEIEVDIEYIKGLLAGLDRDSLELIKTYAEDTLRDGWFEGTRIVNGSFESCLWRNWPITPSAVLWNVSSASGHKIADNEWYTATVDWILIGIAQPVGLAYGRDIPVDAVLAMPRIACQWRTKVLFGTSADQTLTILYPENPRLYEPYAEDDEFVLQPLIEIVDSENPRPLDPDDKAELQPLIERAAAAYEAETVAFLRDMPSLFQAVGAKSTSISTPYGSIFHGDINPG